MTIQQILPHIAALLRHFADLRDGDHGGAVGRAAKEDVFRRSVPLIDPQVKLVLTEINDGLLGSTGTIETTGVIASGDGGLMASWTLSWPRQKTAGIAPITVIGHYGRGFHHPHLRARTVAEWPFNVFTRPQAEEILPILRAIVTAEVHNLVFEADYRIIPAIHPD